MHAGVDREESAPDVRDGLHEVAERDLGHGRELSNGDLAGNNLHVLMFAVPGVPRKRRAWRAPDAPGPGEDLDRACAGIVLASGHA